MKLHTECAAVDLRCANLDQLGQPFIEPRVPHRFTQSAQCRPCLGSRLVEIRKLHPCLSCFRCRHRRPNLQFSLLSPITRETRADSPVKIASNQVYSEIVATA